MSDKSRAPRKKSIIGLKFGRLTVASITDNRTAKKAIYYDCICECGGHRLVIVDSLRKGNVTQCQECADIARKKILDANSYQTISKALTVEGTNLAIISEHRQNSNNTSGYKGVTYDKKAKKWRAQIVFKGKAYNLGRFADKEEAIKARLQAEKELFEPLLQKYRESGIMIDENNFAKYIMNKERFSKDDD